MATNDVEKTICRPPTPFRRMLGAALVEFSIISPLLFLLLLGFTEVGRLLYQQNQLTKQLTTGARYIARVPNAVNPINCGPGPGWIAAVIRAHNLISQTVDGGTVLPGLNAPGAITFSSSAGAVGTNACVIRVEAQVNYNAMFSSSPGALLTIGPIMLNSTAEERFIGL